MHPVELNPTTETTHSAQAKGERDPSRFREVLGRQSFEQLQMLLDPAQTLSMPGAASALAESISAELDPEAQASARLTSESHRVGARERGIDAASQARQELSTSQSSSTSSLSSASIAPDGAERTTPNRGSNAQARADAPGATTQTERTESGVSQPIDDEPAVQAQTQDANRQPTMRSEQGARRGESALSAITRQPAGAGQAAPANQSSVQALQSASAPSKVVAPAGGGEIADRKPSLTTGPKRVLRQENRQFEAQLQRGLAQVLRQKGGTLNLKLTPVELGEVRISLSVAQGRVSGTIEASNESARGLLEQNLEKLKSSLEQRGVTVDRLEVRLAGASSGERAAAQGQDAHAGQQEGTNAGGGSAEGGSPGGERRDGTTGGTPGTPETGGNLGEEPRADDEAAHGSAAEPLGGWLRLDTVA